MFHPLSIHDDRQPLTFIAVPPQDETAPPSSALLAKDGERELQTPHGQAQPPATQPVGPQFPEQLKARAAREYPERVFVVSTPASELVDDTERDFYIVCTCGWASLPLAEFPKPHYLVCDACQERRSGALAFDELARVAEVRGFRIER